MTQKSSSNHYIDNQKLYAEMVKYITAYRAAKEAGETTPRVNNYIGECLYLIGTNLATDRRFVKYPFKDDMVCDGVENCLRYIHNFDPQKTNNPFAYFTQIMYYAFLRRIDKEKKQLYVKYRTIQEAASTNNLVHLAPEDSKHFETVTGTMFEGLADLAKKFETRQEIKREKAREAKRVKREKDEEENE